jgi:hypothetical protein
MEANDQFPDLAALFPRSVTSIGIGSDSGWAQNRYERGSKAESSVSDGDATSVVKHKGDILNKGNIKIVLTN